MSLRNHLIIFAKSPRLGTVKSRLAREIGWVAATGFYRRTLRDTVRKLSRDARWRTYLAVTPDRDVWNHGLWPGGIPRITQGSGDLGDRMARLAAAPPPGPVVIVGTDIPALNADHVARAFNALGDHDMAFGPASDGGYYLVGFRRRPAMPDAFSDVRWSTPHALADTLVALPPGTTVAMGDVLSDVDDGAAFDGLARISHQGYGLRRVQAFEPPGAARKA